MQVISLEISGPWRKMQSKGCEDALVSAVIPTHHRPEFLRRAISSALGQTYPRIEVIVVLDGPDPVGVDVLRKIGDKRLRFFCLPKGAGEKKGSRPSHFAKGCQRPWKRPK